MHEPKTKGQHLQVLGIHPQRLIFGDYYNFDHHGEFVQTVGMADGTIGQQIIASIYRVHFGSFGGLPVKITYALFSVVLAYVIASGFTIYLLKRREKGTAVPRLEAAWTSVLWGTPAALSLALLGSVTGHHSRRRTARGILDMPRARLLHRRGVSETGTAGSMVARRDWGHPARCHARSLLRSERELYVSCGNKYDHRLYRHCADVSDSIDQVTLASGRIRLDGFRFFGP